MEKLETENRRHSSSTLDNIVNLLKQESLVQSQVGLFTGAEPVISSSSSIVSTEGDKEALTMSCIVQ